MLSPPLCWLCWSSWCVRSFLGIRCRSRDTALSWGTPWVWEDGRSRGRGSGPLRWAIRVLGAPSRLGLDPKRSAASTTNGVWSARTWLPDSVRRSRGTLRLSSLGLRHLSWECLEGNLWGHSRGTLEDRAGRWRGRISEGPSRSRRTRLSGWFPATRSHGWISARRSRFLSISLSCPPTGVGIRDGCELGRRRLGRPSGARSETSPRFLGSGRSWVERRFLGTPELCCPCQIWQLPVIVLVVFPEEFRWEFYGLLGSWPVFVLDRQRYSVSPFLSLWETLRRSPSSVSRYSRRRIRRWPPLESVLPPFACKFGISW